MLNYEKEEETKEESHLYSRCFCLLQQILEHLIQTLGYLMFQMGTVMKHVNCKKKRKRGSKKGGKELPLFKIFLSSTLISYTLDISFEVAETIIKHAKLLRKG